MYIYNILYNNNRVSAGLVQIGTLIYLYLNRYTKEIGGNDSKGTAKPRAHE